MVSPLAHSQEEQAMSILHDPQQDIWCEGCDNWHPKGLHTRDGEPARDLPEPDEEPALPSSHYIGLFLASVVAGLLLTLFFLYTFWPRF
jgi:hypothetical protein